MAPAIERTAAPLNEEAVRAWDTVLYERWKSHRPIFVGGASVFSERVFETDPPAPGARCIDFGSGFGDTTQRLAEIVGPEGHAHGVDSSPQFIQDARAEAAEAGAENVSFEVADIQMAEWDPVHDYAFARFGTQFFANPVQGMRAIRSSLKPGGRLCKIVWRRKVDVPVFAETEIVAERFLEHPEENLADTCGPGPFSMGNPDTTRGILEAAGFDEIELVEQAHDYLMGQNLDEAVEIALAIGPAAELVRVNGPEGERRKPEIAAALHEFLARWQLPDGTVRGPSSVWKVTARNPQ
jgi:SAM-dependent methyltransferase